MSYTILTLDSPISPSGNHFSLSIKSSQHANNLCRRVHLQRFLLTLLSPVDGTEARTESSVSKGHEHHDCAASTSDLSDTMGREVSTLIVILGAHRGSVRANTIVVG